MSKIISLPFCLLSLVLLAISMADMVAGKGNICQEGLGLCGSATDCDSRCKARHSRLENPQGSCDYTIHLPLCYCLYSCGTTVQRRPAPKMCNAGLGLCSRQCNSDCCNAKCTGLHQNGQGYCDNNVGVNLCQCSYPC